MNHTTTPPLSAPSTLNLDELDAHVRQIVEPLLRMGREISEATVRCGVIGRSGTGKSSLINAIAGEKIAEVGVTEQTMAAQEFHHGGLTFVDLPGCGTPRWPRDTYVSRLGLADYDCFVLVTSSRFFEDDAYLYRALAVDAGRPVFVVRTMMDRAVEAGARENGLSASEVADKIRQDLLSNLSDHAPDRVYLTSAWYPTQYGLPALIDDMTRALGGVKRARFVADAAAYSEVLLREKRGVADQVVAAAAAAAFMNGFNPLPGVDIGADLAILTGLGRKVLHVYGLTEAQLAFTERVVGPGDAAFKAGTVMAARLATQFATREGAGLLLRKLGQHATARYASKWLPLVGQLFSAGVGSRLTYSFGGEAVDGAEEAARKVLEAVASGVGGAR